jgi:hypothetical protein
VLLLVQAPLPVPRGLRRLLLLLLRINRRAPAAPEAG